MKLSMKRTLSLALTLVIVLSLFALPMQVHAATLKKGSTGTQVKYLQMNLIGLGYLSGSADGKYGSATTKAVEKYQKAYGLTVDGIAGDKTQNSIKTQVKNLQMNLIGLGYLSGSADGIYGSGTKRAVEKYQKAYGLTVDGIAGSRTLTSVHNQVKNLQSNLIGLGYLSGSADGVYGSKTKAAVKAYQTAYGLTVDGIAGGGTLTSVRNLVKSIQKKLINLGYLSGSADGIYGSGTKSAVKKYQKAHGLTADGIAGVKTRKALLG